jgi:hypothetical protein
MLSTLVASGVHAAAVQSSVGTDTVVARADAALATGLVKTSSLAGSGSRTRSGDLLPSQAEASPTDESADLDAMALLAGLVLVVGIAVRRLRA